LIDRERLKLGLSFERLIQVGDVGVVMLAMMDFMVILSIYGSNASVA
jgi:hypothetical protein